MQCINQQKGKVRHWPCDTQGQWIMDTIRNGQMMITSPAQAMERLDDVREEAAVREAAIRFLAEAPTPAVITRLVQALQDDDTRRISSRCDH